MASGRTAPKSSSCGYTAPSELLKSAQVTLEGNQNRSFQNQEIPPPAMVGDYSMPNRTMMSRPQYRRCCLSSCQCMGTRY